MTSLENKLPNLSDITHTEDKTKRSMNSKIYTVDKKVSRLITSTCPIHFYSELGKGDNVLAAEWEEIDTTLTLKPSLSSFDNYITNKNQHTVGFRDDKSLSKFKGIRLYESAGTHQIEFTLKKVIIDEVTLKLPAEFTSINVIDGATIEHVLTGDITIGNIMNSHYTRDYVKTSGIENIEVWEEIDLTGYQIINNSLGGIYIPSDDKKQFIFRSTTESDKEVWIPKPMMWNEDGEINYGVYHSLEIINSEIIYKKGLTQEGEDWLAEQSGFIYFDGTSYFMDSDADDGFLRSSVLDVVEQDAWDGAREAETASSVYDYTGTMPISARVEWQPKTAQYNGIIDRIFMLFDTTGLPSTATITDASLNIYITVINNDGMIKLFAGGQGEVIEDTDYDQDLHDPALLQTGSLSTGDTEIDISDAIPYIVQAGKTPFCLRDRNYDAKDVLTATMASVTMNSADAVSDNPYLDITYTDGPSDCNNPGEISLNKTNYGNELYVQVDNYGNELRMYNTCS